MWIIGDEEDQIDDTPDLTDGGDDTPGAGDSTPGIAELPDVQNALHVPDAEDDPVVEPVVDNASAPPRASKPGEAAKDVLAAPPVKGATEGTVQDQIVARNKDRFAKVKDDPAQQEQLFLAERFLGTPGLREAYLKGDDKQRSAVMKALVREEAQAQLGGYRGKDRQQRLKAIEARLTTHAMGMADMPEFNPDPAPKKKDEAGVGLGTELAVGAAAGFGKGAAATLGAAGTLLGLAGGENTDRNALGRFADGMRKFADEAIADFEKTREKYTTEDTKKAREEWDAIKKAGSNYEIAKVAATSPRMWANEGAHMLGLLAPALVAGGGVARGAGALADAAGLVGSASAGVARVAGAAGAGGVITEASAAEYEKSLLAQPVDKHKTYVGWWDIKHTLETTRGKAVADQEVSNVMAREMRDLAWKYDFPLATATMLIGPVGISTVAKRMGVEMAEGYTGGAVSRAVKGAASEGTSNTAQQFASNTAREAVRQGMEAGDGSAGHLKSAAGTDAAKDGLIDSAILGGVMGGAMARKQHTPDRPVAPEPPPKGGDVLASEPKIPTPDAPKPDVLAQAMAKVQGEAVNAPVTPHNAVPSAPKPDVLAQAVAKVDAPAPRDVFAQPAPLEPTTKVNPETAQALASQHGAPAVADDGTIYAPPTRAIDAADPYHVVNSLDPEAQSGIAAEVAQRLDNPGYKLAEAAASDVTTNIVKAEMPKAPPEVIAEIAARVRNGAAAGGVVRAPKVDKAEAKQLSFRETRQKASEAAQKILGNSDYVAEIEALAPGRVGDSKKAREWAQKVNEAEGLRVNRPADFTPEHQAILAYDAVIRPGRLGHMTPSVRQTKLSVGERPATSVSPGRVHEIAHDYVNNTMSDLGVNAVVVPTHADINPAFGDIPANSKAFVHTDADGTTTVGLVADMLGTEADVRAALEHEVVGHYKLERVLGEKGVTELASRVFAGVHRDPQSTAVWEAIQRDYPLGDGVTLKDQVLEFVARAAEAPADTNGGKVTLQGVKDALTSAGYRATDSMSLPELKALLNEIRAVRDPDYNPIASKDYATAGQKQVVNPKEQVIRQTRLRTAERYMFDRAIDMLTMFRDMGIENSLTHRLFLSLQSAKDRIVNGEIIENHVAPLVKAIDAIGAKHGRTRDEITHMMNDWAQAKHRDERELWLRNTHAPLKSAELTALRDKIVQAGLKGEANGGMSPRAARARLDELVTDDTVKNASDRLENTRRSGLSKADADKILAHMRDAGVLADFEALGAPGGELARLRNVTKKYATSSGYYHAAMTEMAGYEYYVPGKGVEYDDRATRQFTEAFSTVNDKQGATAGRKDMADHGITQLMLEAQLMGARHVNQQLMRNIASAIEKHKDATWGKVGEAQHIQYNNGEFIYPEKPNQFMVTDFAISDPSTGATRILTLNDKGVAEVMSNTYKSDDPMNGALRLLNAGTRTLSRLYTAMSPSFLVTNVIRDATASLEAIAFERTRPGDGASTKPPKVNTDQLKSVAKAMTEAYLRGDTRELFMASQGEREVLMARWRTADEQAKLAKEFEGDPEGLARAQKMREIATDFVESGGVIGFGRFIDPVETLKASDDVLRATPQRPSNVLEAPRYAAQMAAHGLDAVTGKLEAVGTYLDNAHRLGVYMGLRELGVSKDTALIRARTTSLDFNQRSGFRDGAVSGPTIMGLYMFVQPGLTGLHTMLTRRVWQGGEIPLETVKGPDGQVFERLKPGWQKELNWPVATYLAAVGFGTTMMAAQMMGQKDGEDAAKRIALSSWFRNHLIPGGERPLMVPQQVGMHQWFSGIGTMIALKSLGYGDAGELAKEYTNVLLNHAIPGLKFQTPDGQQSVVQMLVQGFTPALAQPIVQQAMNRNAFGQSIYNEQNPQKPQFNSDMGRKNTPQAYTALATQVREASGIDLQPEVYMHWVGQFGYVGSTINEIAKYNSNTSTDKGLYDVAKIGLRRDFSGDSYEARQYSKFLDDTYNPVAKQLAAAKKADMEETSTMKGGRGKRNPVGPREAAFLAANPQATELLKAKRGLDDASAVINQSAAQAKAKGEVDRSEAIQQVRRDAVREFLLMQKEGRLRDAPRSLDRFVRQRLAGL